MTPLSKRLQIVVRALESGFDLQLGSGHVLSWDETNNGPGYWFETFEAGNPTAKEEGVMQINSDVAWADLIAYARNATEERLQEITVASINLNKVVR